ncbi:RagB/SusD family nutrient uptake outer membrane protein [uncultured Bacteroides sp.]|uniref:RagB/SusD family nutrient uptake outer membrane protein n=1 Tax=uncultured Bacteroides sp. TaxID=162156 RepID=UPI00261E7378|nr:RagB/SusD family nutrient uptake outer membrane protein [uncultured Bacteroides sp.]
MKTLYRQIGTAALAAALTLSLPSCSDFLDEHPYGQLTSEGFFSSKEDLAASLNSLYSVVATSMGQNNYCGTNFLAGDDISTHPASNKQPLREHDQYNVTDNNSWLVSMWEQRYKVIKAANFIINNAGRTPDVDPEEITRAVAQAHYWRAFSYFYLVTTWGEVPIMLEEEINYAAPLHPVEEVYELIVSDLKKAEEGCPVMYDQEPYARNGVNIAVSQGAVKATMAYVYMCMAGWPLNKGAEYYRLAAEKAEEVIDGAENGTYYYRLLDEFSQIHSWAYNSNNPELLLGVYYNRDRTAQMTPLTDFLLDMKQGGWGDTNGEIKFWKEFPEGPRKDATYFPKIMLADGELRDWWYDTDPPSREVVAPVFMKSVEASERGTEFDYTDPTPLAQYGEKTIQVIRLAQVYCWYAESVGRSGQVTAKAVEMLNRVRNRADGQPTNLYTTSMTPDELAEAAYNEHGWEMAGYYWAALAGRARDMFRMYRFKDHFEFRKENPLIEVAPGVFRKEAVPVTGTWDDSRMYSPYPYEDAILNPNLKGS